MASVYMSVLMGEIGRTVAKKRGSGNATLPPVTLIPPPCT